MQTAAVSSRSSRARLFASLLERVSGQELPADELLQAAVDAVARTMATEVATLYAFDGRAEELILAATRGLPRSAVGFVSLHLGEGLSGRAAAARASIAVEDVRVEPTFKVIPGFDQSHYRSMLAVPVMAGTTLLGALNVQTVATRTYDLRDAQDLAAIAATLAPVLGDLLSRDLSLRLRGPSVLSELDGIVTGSGGSITVCERLVDRLRLLFPDARCAVTLLREAGVPISVGDDLAPPEKAAIDRCLAQGVVQTAGGERGGAILALPLAGATGILGALIIGAGDNPKRASFGTYEVAYVETLATQAQVALERAGSDRQLPVDGPHTDGVLGHVDELTRMVLDDVGLDRLVARAGEICAAPLAVVDAAGTVIAGEALTTHRAEIELRAGNSYLGRLIVGAVDACEPLLAAAARIVALELSKWKVRFDVETRLRGDVLDLLVEGTWTDERQVSARAGLAGVDLTRSYAAVLFAFDTAALAGRHGALALRGVEREIERACGEPPVCVTFLRPEGMLALIDPAARRHGVANAAALALSGLRRLAGETAVSAGIGPACVQLQDYGTAVRQATMAAQLGLRMRSSLPVDAARLGAFRILLALDAEAPLRAFVDESLGSLRSPDGYGSELIRTLEAFHASGERLRPAADLLFVHPNTLKYRLARIEALTRRSLDNPSDRLDLYLALYALRLLEPERGSLLPNNIGAAVLSAADEEPALPA